jgi:hypothetical protein
MISDVIEYSLGCRALADLIIFIRCLLYSPIEARGFVPIVVVICCSLLYMCCRRWYGTVGANRLYDVARCYSLS